MIMALMGTHDSSMKIHDRKLHVLLIMEVFKQICDNLCISAKNQSVA